jgi:hypothetical protein
MTKCLLFVINCGIEIDSEIVKFDLGNKRVIIYNSPVICEEITD